MSNFLPWFHFSAFTLFYRQVFLADVSQLLQRGNDRYVWDAARQVTRVTSQFAQPLSQFIVWPHIPCMEGNHQGCNAVPSIILSVSR